MVSGGQELIAELSDVGGSLAWGMPRGGGGLVSKPRRNVALGAAGKLKHLTVGGALAALACSALERGCRDWSRSRPWPAIGYMPTP